MLCPLGIAFDFLSFSERWRISVSSFVKVDGLFFTYHELESWSKRGLFQFVFSEFGPSIDVLERLEKSEYLLMRYWGPVASFGRSRSSEPRLGLYFKPCSHFVQFRNSPSPFWKNSKVLDFIFWWQNIEACLIWKSISWLCFLLFIMSVTISCRERRSEILRIILVQKPNFDNLWG